MNPKVKSEQDVLNFPPQLDHQFVGVASVAPQRRGRAPGVVGRLFRGAQGPPRGPEEAAQAVLDTDLADFNRTVQEQGIPAVAPAPAKGK